MELNKSAGAGHEQHRTRAEAVVKDSKDTSKTETPGMSISPALSTKATPNATSVLMRPKANENTLSQAWLEEAADKIDKTNELINTAKSNQAIQAKEILLELDTVFEKCGIVAPSSSSTIKSSLGQADSSGSNTPIPSSMGELSHTSVVNLKNMNKTAF